MQTKEKGQLISLRDYKITHVKGFAWYVYLPENLPYGDSEENPYYSQAILFENGVEMGPPHMQHYSIQDDGKGCYSHWGQGLYFSSTDNSSPLKNGLDYQLMLPSEMFLHNPDPISASLSKFNLESRPSTYQYELAKTFFRRIWHKVPLPDWGRKIEHDKAFLNQFRMVSSYSDSTCERKYNLNELSKLTLTVDGDIVECGCYKGASAYFLAKHIIDKNLDKKIHLFDSFEGLSTPEDIDGTYWSSADLHCTIEDTKSALANLQSMSFVNIYKGWIPERFSEIEDHKFCFVHIDVDLYQPTLDSISFFYPRMSHGGIILFDDYGFDTCPGATESIDIFMRDKPEQIINIASGGAFIVKE